MTILKQLIAALEPFAEQPNSHMDDYPCHRGITTKEKCGRCSRAIAAYKAIGLAKAAELAAEPDWEAIKGMRIGEMTEAQKADSHERWIRDQIGWFNEYSRGHINFLLHRLDLTRASLNPLKEE